jgi:hypothetical protein
LLGCRRITSPNGTSDLCRFTIESLEHSRPSNKTETIENTIIKGIIIGTTGTAAVTQLGAFVYIMCI